MASQFWLLKPPPTQQPAKEAPGVDHEIVTCSIRNDHGSGGRRISHLSVFLPKRCSDDVIWTWFNDILVTQRVLDIFQKHKVTGYEIEPVKTAFAKRSETPPPTLFNLIVTGWGGIGKNAGVTLTESCPGCGHRVYEIAEPSRLADPSDWDGSDLFMVWPLPRFRFASDRLAQILIDERISGIKLIPAPKIPMQSGEGASPGQLRYWMPEERARELQERFEI
ncbi:MAG TPA: hypothetical protein VHN11_04685 [Xanthobacteraceae bacterium]|jgi:hypothetical protein|nr:hypothetical protein [Xanthobacteraceae bacterium]